MMQSCYKATIPISRLRELIDRDDVSDNTSYRCERCSKCLDCRHSNKFHAMSIQERREQALIEESVKLNEELRKVTVQLLHEGPCEISGGETQIRLQLWAGC